MSELAGKKVIVFLAASGFRFEGEVLSDDGEMLEILDVKTKRKSFFSRKALERIEVLE